MPPLFNWIKEAANIDFFELAKTFNCGIGFLIFAEKSDVDTIIKNVNDVGYNSFLIGKMIENILASTYEKFQLLIVDDGSTDRTVDIINSYVDRRISLIKKHNSGLADSLNIGLKKAKFSLIARIDADDLIFEERLKIQLDFFQNNNYDIVGSNAIIINEFGERLGQTNFPSFHQKIKSKLL